MSTFGGEIWIPPVPAPPDVGTQQGPAMPGFFMGAAVFLRAEKRAGSPPTTGPGVPDMRMAGPCSNSNPRPWSLATSGALGVKQKACQLCRMCGLPLSFVIDVGASSPCFPIEH
jgi:hypothetical protein